MRTNRPPEIPSSFPFLTLMSYAFPYYCNSNQIQQTDPGKHIYRAKTLTQEKLTDEDKMDYAIIC